MKLTRIYRLNDDFEIVRAEGKSNYFRFTHTFYRLYFKIGIVLAIISTYLNNQINSYPLITIMHYPLSYQLTYIVGIISIGYILIKSYLQLRELHDH